MDLFRFTSAPNQPMRGGRLIANPDSVTWVERYRDAGDLTIETTLSSGLRSELPVGSLVSHVDTKEVVRIETHEISDNDSGDPGLTIKGRTMEAPLLQNRVAGSNIAFPTPTEPSEYILPAWRSDIQARHLIQFHIEAQHLIDDNDAVPYLDALTIAPSAGLTIEERRISPGSVYERLIEILAVDELGLRTERPNNTSDTTKFIVHKGVDMSSQIVLSSEKGDVNGLAYLQSNVLDKNCALIVGRWCQTRVVDTSASGYNRRWMVVDASDIDNVYESAPTGTTRTRIINLMQARGRQALAKKKAIEITKASASKDDGRYIYRKDYDIGDIVMVSGGYGSATKMRVTEYAEIQDKTGFTGYPTLEPLEGES